MGNDLNLGFWGLDEYVTRVTYSSKTWEPVVCDVFGFGFFLCVYVLCMCDVREQGFRFRALEVDEYVTYSSNILSIHSSKARDLEGDIEGFSFVFVCFVYVM
jgi:hypothetical protein